MGSRLVAPRYTLRIILVRHGRLRWDFATPIAGRAFAEWLQGENRAPIDPSHRPSAELQHLVLTADGVVASPLRRAMESARLLAPTAPPLIDACFREAELPSAIPLGLRLRPGIWAWLARTAWLCGWSPGVESLEAARGSVVLVGHGLMNVLIAAQLRRAGWSGPVLPPRRYWAFAVYERVAA